MQNSFYQRTGLTLHRELVQLSPENWFSSQQRTGLALSRNLVQLTAEIWFNFLLRTSSAPTRELVQLSSENWFSSKQRTGSAPSRELVQLPVCIEYKGTVNVTQNFGNLEEEVRCREYYSAAESNRVQQIYHPSDIQQRCHPIKVLSIKDCR